MKNFVYLAKPPVSDLAVIDRQLRLAVDYQRRLTAVEIERRRAVEETYVSALPHVHATCAAAERDAEAAVEALRAARSSRATKTASREEGAHRVEEAPGVTPAEAHRLHNEGDVAFAKAALLLARCEQSSARAAKRAARKALTPTIKPALRALDEAAYAAQNAAYNAQEFADLAWGTKLYVRMAAEAAAKAAAKEGTLPRMPSYDGTGAVVVQTQGGLAPADAATDTRFRLEVVDHAAWVSRCEVGKRLRRQAEEADGFFRPVKPPRSAALPPPPPREDRGQYGIAHLRVGSVGRAPVWASWPVRLSRPLPEGSVIKWARMHADKVGTRVEWRLLVVVDEPAVAAKPAEGRTLAVNLGWRNLGDGGVRVAYAVGTDGREEEVRVPAHFLRKLAHSEHVRSVRDRLCDAAHAALRDFVTAMTTGPEEISATDLDTPDKVTTSHDGAVYDHQGEVWRRRPLPAWFTEATRWAQNWRGPQHLARLVRDWEKQRFEGDNAVFVALSTWRNGKDARGRSVGNHHLRFWESDERVKAYRHRNEVYRQVARRWAREYDRVVVTDMNLRDFAEEPAPEDGPRSEGSAQRRTRSVAGPSVLRGEVKNACASSGAAFEEKRGAWTRICAACGVESAFDAARALVRTCPACGDVSDQDRNHCLVMLASDAAARGSREPLAPSVSPDEGGVGTKKAGRWGKRRSRTAAQTGGTTDGSA